MSSDSDDDVEIKKLKSTGVRGRRGFSRKQSSNVGPISASSAVYSSCVSKCFNTIKSKSIADDFKQALTEGTNDDVEDDIAAKTHCTAESTVPTLKKSDTIQLSDGEEANENSQDILNTPTNSGNTNMNANCIQSPSPPPPPVISERSRRLRGGKQKKTLLSAVSAFNKNLSDAKSQLIETTDFQSPEPEVCVIDDDDITVRIDIRGNISRYRLAPDEALMSVVSSIAVEQQVPEWLVMLVHKDRTLRPTETPVSLQLHAADIIKCHIMNEDQASLNDSVTSYDQEDLVELVLQTRGSKHKEIIKTPRDKPMIMLMRKYVKLMKQRNKKAPIEKEAALTEEEELGCLQFLFDGDIVGQNETPASLDMDDGDIIDVNQHSVTVIS